MNRFGLGTLNKFAEQAKQAGNKIAASASEASSRLPTFDQLNTYQTGKGGRRSGVDRVGMHGAKGMLCKTLSRCTMIHTAP